MKLAFVILNVLAAIVVSVDANIELIKKFETAKEVCMEKTGVTKEDLRTLMKQQVPQTKTGQCFVACAGKEMGVITDNKINVAQVKSLAADFKDENPKMYNGILKLIETCASETDTDQCVAAKKIMECVQQGIAKLFNTKKA